MPAGAAVAPGQAGEEHSRAEKLREAHQKDQSFGDMDCELREGPLAVSPRLITAVLAETSNPTQHVHQSRQAQADVDASPRPSTKMASKMASQSGQSECSPRERPSKMPCTARSA